MTTTPLTLDEIHELAMTCLVSNGADELNAGAIADNMTGAERDGSHSHGLFRLPAHITGLRSGKVNGTARPTVKALTPAALKLEGDNCYAPLAHKIGIPELASAAKTSGIGVLAMTGVHHMAALWPEVEALAEQNLAAIACTTYMPAVAPTGATKALFGTNPLAFAWPRPGTAPVVFDMATASMAMGEVQIAARDGHDVPPGTGLDETGAPTTDPGKIANGGVLLPFGGHKGSAISMMVELLTAGLTNESFSFEAKDHDNGDGSPPQGGEFILAMSPALLAGEEWADHSGSFLDRMSAMDGVRMPGQRRHENRLSTAPRQINTELIEKIRSLATGE